MVVIHPKLKLQPQYPGKTISAWQTLPRNPSKDRIAIRGWGRVFERRRKGAILRGMLVSLLEGDLKPLCLRHYSTSVAMTKAAWAFLKAASGRGDNLATTLEAVLLHSKRGKLLDLRNRLFCVPLEGVGTRGSATFKLVAYPGDLGSTVYTIMLPLEK